MEGAMEANISDFLKPSREEIIEAEIRGLRDLHAPHYHDIDLNQLQLRAIHLVESFITSLSLGPASFVKYMQSIAEDRFREGFFLEEIQAALNLLGEKVWEIVAQRAPVPRRVDYLGQVSATIGAAKDQLARVYTGKLQHAESRTAALQGRLDELFAGTVSGPDMDEDDSSVNG
jgi:hypothetical protein